MSEPENPPAFPNAWDNDGPPGMTLRDYLAAQALPATIAAVSSGKVPLPNWVGRPLQTAAFLAYCAADAMLEARAVAEPGEKA